MTYTGLFMVKNCVQRESNCYCMKSFLQYLNISFWTAQSSKPQSKKARLLFAGPTLSADLGHNRRQDPPKRISFTIFQTTQKLSDYYEQNFVLSIYSFFLLKDLFKYTSYLSLRISPTFIYSLPQTRGVTERTVAAPFPRTFVIWGFSEFRGPLF